MEAKSHIPALEYIADQYGAIQLTEKSKSVDLIWLVLHPKPEDVFLDYRNKIVSKIPGMELIAKKKFLGEALNLMNDFWPEIFNFFPRTYTFPDDAKRLAIDMKGAQKYYIAKPTSGSQGDGIYLIKNYQELKSYRFRNIESTIV